jgi:hypothetical protein
MPKLTRIREVESARPAHPLTASRRFARPNSLLPLTRSFRTATTQSFQDSYFLVEEVALLIRLSLLQLRVKASSSRATN